ncbi:site-specific DNA-methyltransferase [Mycoplasma sp. 005V]|uniref:site-specific DNA-methyltransferase n=1 Tax=Mycoplasma sp. 005V TaxID=3398776 RepID=UPI003A860152
MYIDPPYNTESAGSDGNQVADDKENIKSSKFIYRDKFSRNGWLNMMNERLKMARDLLKEDGVIFVSIDDNEQAYLKVLMDEIFGEENFVTNIVWNKLNAQNDVQFFQANYEYVLVYSKNKSILNVNKIYEENTKGKTISLLLGNTSGGLLNNRFKMGQTAYWNKETNDMIFEHDYDLELAKNSNNPNIYKNNEKLISMGYIPIRPKIYNKKLGCWKWSIEKMNNCKDLLVVKKQKDGSFTLHYKDIREVKVKKYKNILDLSSSNGASILNELGINFSFSKPVKLIKFLIKTVEKNKDIRILDFFAGSGTTAHAVMELNKEDGGNRTYTLVTNNENNIAIDVTYERLFRINNGKGTKGESFKWADKNQPYKQNLDVFWTKYFDTNIFSEKIDNIAILKTLEKELNDFGIYGLNDNVQKLLLDLIALKPVKE